MRHSAEAKYKQLSITHDMTQKDRTQCKPLVQEAKDKEQQEGQGNGFTGYGVLPLTCTSSN